jgi:hypothetical protein
MRPTRLSSAIVIGAASAALFAACTSGSAKAHGGKTGTPTSRLSATRPDNPATSAPPAAGSVLSCGNFIDTHAATAPLQVVLGVVALPTSPGYPALGTSLTGNGNEAQRLFAKTGLVIKPGTTFELVVPAEFADRLSIGWGGEPSTPSHQLIIRNCTNPAGAGWLAYAGGYWIDHPACVPLIVQANGKQQQVHIGLGRACPGQRPPQGPSQS